MDKICEYCSKEYKVKPSKAKRSHYCSKECHNKGQKGKHRSSMLTCPQCYTEFKATKKSQICCSKACDAERRDFERNKEKLCKHCGAVFHSTNKDQKCCSRSCTMELRMADPVEREKVASSRRGKTPWNKNVKMPAEWCEEHRQRVIEYYNSPDGEVTKDKISSALKNYFSTEEGQIWIKQNAEKLRELNKGKNNPFYGKHHSADLKNRFSEERRNIPLSKKHKQAISNSLLGHKKPESYSQKLSERNIQRILDNDGIDPYCTKRTKKGTYTSPKAGDIPFDSSYEEQAYKILDKLSTVESYSRCKFYIEYEIDKKTRRYIPDILVSYTDGTQQVIEIKPATFVEDKVNQAKFAAAEPYCAANDLEFSVWTEEQLFN